MGSILTMFAQTGGGTENAEATIDVPMNTNLVGIQWALEADLDADGEFVWAQLGFGPTLINVNDSRSIISTVVLRNQLTTSGEAANGVNQYFPMPDLPLMGGERLHLNVSSTAGVTAGIFVHLHIAGDMDKPSMRRVSGR